MDDELEEELEDLRRSVAALSEIVVLLMRLTPQAKLEAAQSGLSPRASDLLEQALHGDE